MPEDSLQDIPANVAPATEDGINDAIEAIAVDQRRARRLAEVLDKHPRRGLRRILRLNKYQRAQLMEMNDDEVKQLVRSTREALEGPDWDKFRVQYTEQIETNSPLRIQCDITIRFGIA